MSSNLLKPLRYNSSFPPISSPIYDKIVDRSDFKRGQDKERAHRILGDTGGSLTQGVYDFPDGNFDDKKSPSSVELALRNGVLDKADVDTIARVQKKVAQQEYDEKVQSDIDKEKQAINSARQAFLDEQTGFDAKSAKTDK